MTREEVREAIINTGLFKQRGKLYHYLDLIGSDEFFVYIGYNTLTVYWCYLNPYKYISFEEILQIVPKELAVKLCYHLDLFT